MGTRRRINLRQTARVSYYEPEEPNLDEYVFCSECGDYVYEYCSIHGPLLVIPDDKVPLNPDVPSFVPRAAITIPHVFLHLNYSTIPGAGLGVFTTLTLPRGVRFGPYKGTKSDVIKSSYCWQIRDANNRPSHVVDASDPNTSNWMRYVNCSRHWLEQNLVAYQYRGQIYYRTIKIIPPFTELMVFYGSEFACELGIDLKKYNSHATYAQKLGTKRPKGDETMETKIQEVNSNIETAKEDQSKTNTIKKTETVEVQPKVKKKKHLINTCTELDSLVKPHQTNVELSKSIDETNNVCVESVGAKDLNNNIVNIKNVDNSKPILDSEIPYKTNTKNIKYYNRKKITKYTCDICSFITYRQVSSENHLLLHGNVKGITFFKCKYCLHVCKTETNMKNHEISHTGEKPYSCDICQRKFTQSGHLLNHKRSHTGEKPYSCDICQREFTKSSNLITHKRTHTGEKPYSCDICQRKFTQSGALLAHKRTHTGEKPYSCDICQLKFTQSGALLTHKRTHTGEKPYSCDICQRKFTQSGALLAHKRTHTGEKPYSCDICQRKFTHSNALTTHKMTHTGEKPYSCDIIMST